MSNRRSFVANDDSINTLSEINGIDLNSLNNNIGRVITVFTSSGGCSGRGFTGLLVNVNCNFLKLISSLPTAPPNPFGHQFDIDGDFSNGNSCRERAKFGTAVVIPLRQIVAICFNEI